MNLSFAERLLAWQRRAGRHDLPWQNTRDPYRIWLSEIMLQQTQVLTVIPYYGRFLASFPDVQALAAASVEEVIAHWAGLGYYARARNLHRCAQQVVAVHGGQFPDSPVLLAELPGIGRSTAAAIAAFAFGKKAAILDGNVKRVLCRYWALEGIPGQAAVDRQLWALAEQLLPEAGIESYTQGLMDLGATVCTRQKPRCSDCPQLGACAAQQQGRQAVLPTPKLRKALVQRTGCFVLISDGKRLLLERRPPQGIWGGLLVPPEGPPAQVLQRLGLRLRSMQSLPVMQHSFTHFKLHLEPVLCQVEAASVCAEPGMVWLDIAQAANAGVPTPIKALINQVASAAG